MSWWVQLIACFCAALAFSVLMNQPKSTMIVSALIATAGYALFLLLGSGVTAYFLATILIGLACEVCARLMKRTATLFFTGAIVPLVPGVGLYNTMRYVVDGEYTKAMNTGVVTLLAICGIALAVTITAVLFSSFAGRQKKEKRAC
ncbi:MAG: threonine/serine exporter family protein [Clostridia bacterium]|nr:threonine/serine exporter family protein [Clostridia bacterium]